jgi:hypothetical protein
MGTLAMKALAIRICTAFIGGFSAKLEPGRISYLPLFAGRAGGAEADELGVVVDLREAVPGRDLARPLVEAAVAHLLDAPAFAAGEVVMVPAAADQEGDLAVLTPQRVGVAGVGEPLQVAVDGGQPHALELAVELLGGHGTVRRGQGVDDRRTLLGSPAHKSKR